MTDNTQPEAMDLADWLEAVGGGPSAKRCAALLREQHARIAELESELEAVGAGGVSGPLVGRASPPTAQAEGWQSIKTAPKDEIYRDGQSASLSANAGEPVAQWQKRHPDDEDGRWQNTDAGDAKYWESRPGWQIRALYAAPPTAQAEWWIRVDERLPGEQGPADGDSK